MEGRFTMNKVRMQFNHLFYLNFICSACVITTKLNLTHFRHVPIVHT